MHASTAFSSAEGKLAAYKCSNAKELATDGMLTCDDDRFAGKDTTLQSIVTHQGAHAGVNNELARAYLLHLGCCCLRRILSRLFRHGVHPARLSGCAFARGSLHKSRSRQGQDKLAAKQLMTVQMRNRTPCYMPVD